jgi:hypothetical protein
MAQPEAPDAGKSLSATIHNFNDRLKVIENNAIPVAAGPGGAAAGGVGVQMAELAAQNAAMGGQIARLSARIDNGFARTINSHASRNADELVPLVNDGGALPEGFPATLGAFRELADAPLSELLAF